MKDGCALGGSTTLDSAAAAGMLDVAGSAGVNDGISIRI